MPDALMPVSACKYSHRFSVVVPVYQCGSCIRSLYERVTRVFDDIEDTFELILVDDFSRDDGWAVIRSLAEADSRVKAIQLSRNFGQHHAITAGLAEAGGEWVVVMDCDLQDQPEEIPKLYAKAMQGYDVVLAQRVAREDAVMKRLLSKVFYRTLGYLTETEQDPTVANFGVYHHKVIQAVLSMPEATRFFPVMVRWVGFATAKVRVQHRQRHSGTTSYSFGRLFSLATDTILAFSDKPLRLMARGGLWMSTLALMYGLVVIGKAINGDYSVMGWPSLLASIWLLSGVIIFLLGVVGLYVGKTFQQAKMRPLYIVNRTISRSAEHEKESVSVSNEHERPRRSRGRSGQVWA